MDWTHFYSTQGEMLRRARIYMNILPNLVQSNVFFVDLSPMLNSVPKVLPLRCNIMRGEKRGEREGIHSQPTRKKLERIKENDERK